MMKTLINCSNCGKQLKTGEKELAEKNNITECAECLYNLYNGIRQIEKYNEWLNKE